MLRLRLASITWTGSYCARLVQGVVRPLEDAEHRERAVLFLVDVVEDVVIVDREVVAPADALQHRGARWVRIVGEADDRLADQPQRALGDQLELAVGAVGDVQLGGHPQYPAYRHR